MTAQPVHNAEANRALGIVHRKKKNDKRAVQSFLAAVKADPKDHISLLNLSEIFHANKEPAYAVEYAMQAVLAAPDVRAYKQHFLTLAIPVNFAAHSVKLQEALQICLDSPDIDSSGAGLLWEKLLRLHPRFSGLYRVNDRDGLFVFDRKRFAQATDYNALLEPFFLAGLRNLLVTTFPAFEDFLTCLRAWLLKQDKKEERFLSDADYIKLAAALSHYALFTEHIFYTSEEEKEKLEQLRARLESAEDPVERDVAIYACYAPLYTLGNAAALAAATGLGADIGSVITAQVKDYADLQERRKAIVSLTEVDDATSLKVQEQYEEFPYPRWKALPPSVTEADKDPALADRKLRMLIAGCGTGKDPLMYALALPKAEILAVDLSRSSIAYAMRKAEEYGVKNITFRQADILKLKGHPEQFDYIGCIGVLHHMKDPIAGWEVLAGLLKPGGTLMVGLYSEAARWSIVAARQAVARLNIGHDADSMRAFRHKAQEVLKPDVLRDLQGFNDYYNLSMYRDLIFHVQEHRTDIGEIKVLLQRFGLSFGGFTLQPAALEKYRALFPDDPAADDIDRWVIFDKKHPEAFRDMYVFWCKKPF